MIGLFDSGLGGLSVLRSVRAALPEVDVVYFGDNGHIPYGARPLAQVRQFSAAITRCLIAHGAQVIVIACNTASAAALRELRQSAEFAGVPFVGMEPAVKPAAENTRTGVVGVLATPATFQGELYASVVERFAQGVTVLQQVCPGLVQAIEAGRHQDPATEAGLRGWLAPLLARNIDVLVLGCTHYPFVIPLLEKICGPGVRVIDPSPAVARQAARVWVPLGGPPLGDPSLGDPSLGGSQENAAPPKSKSGVTYLTSGDPADFARALEQLDIERGPVHAVHWEANEIIASTKSGRSHLAPPQVRGWNTPTS